jgi:hypothetical protein
MRRRRRKTAIDLIDHPHPRKAALGTRGNVLFGPGPGDQRVERVRIDRSSGSTGPRGAAVPATSTLSSSGRGWITGAAAGAGTDAAGACTAAARAEAVAAAAGWGVGRGAQGAQAASPRSSPASRNRVATAIPAPAKPRSSRQGRHSRARHGARAASATDAASCVRSRPGNRPGLLRRNRTGRSHGGHCHGNLVPAFRPGAAHRPGQHHKPHHTGRHKAGHHRQPEGPAPAARRERP